MDALNNKDLIKRELDFIYLNMIFNIHLILYSLHMSAAAASRDITLFHAYELLHQHNYDVAEAIKVSRKLSY